MYMICIVLCYNHFVDHSSEEGLKMASNKTGINNINAAADRNLGSTLLKIVAYGVAGGALLISGAKRFGEVLVEKQENDYKKLEEQRAADREEIRRIVENDPAEQ